MGRSLGFASTRADGERAQYGPTLGIFIDIGGTDTYGNETSANNTRWFPVERDTLKNLYSIGIDADEGSIAFDNE